MVELVLDKAPVRPALKMTEEAKEKSRVTKREQWAAKRGFQAPSKTQLESDLATMTLSQTAKKYGVSDPTIRRWLSW